MNGAAGLATQDYEDNSSVHYDGKVYVLCAQKIVLLDILSPSAFTMFITSLRAVVRAVNSSHSLLDHSQDFGHTDKHRRTSPCSPREYINSPLPTPVSDLTSLATE